MMTLISYLVLLILLAGSSTKQPNSANSNNGTTPTSIVSTSMDTVDSQTKNRAEIRHKIPTKNTAFKDGEELTFRIRYGFVTAGTAKMSVSKETYKTIPVYHLRTTAVSAGAFSWIYEVDDIVSSFVDYKHFYPIRFEKRLREGGYKADLLTDYVPRDSLATVEFIRYKSNMKVKKRNVYDVKVPPFAQDVLSSFYYIRLQDLNVGESVFLTNHEKKKVYDLEVIVHKKETIEVEAGKFRCVMVEPVVKGEGLFKSKGRLRVWLTDDDKKIPVQMKTEVLVGDITTELIKIEGVYGKVEAQKKK